MVDDRSNVDTRPTLLLAAAVPLLLPMADTSPSPATALLGQTFKT